MKKYFKNFASLSQKNKQPQIEIITDESGNEVGFRIGGIATTFDVRNENGETWTAGDFDMEIQNYFKRGGFNMICPIEHMECDWLNRGVFEKVEQDNEKMTVIAAFYKDACKDYEVLKGQIKRGILQGFSTYGWIDYQNHAHLMNISLVANPSDKGGKLFENSTNFIGFDEPKQEIDLF